MKVGVVGTGVMGGHHLRVIQTIPALQMTCALDTNADKLAKICRERNVTPCQELAAMLPQVDAVVVATPTVHHHAIAKFFLEHGKHVLVEKPLTETVRQSDQLIRLAQKKKVMLAVGHLERFNPVVEYIQGIIDQPRFIEVQRLGVFSPRSLDVDVILDLMIHDLDIILQWDCSGIREIRAAGVPIISKKIDIANVRLEFRSGLVANITASRVSQSKTRKLRIFQRNLYISADYTTRQLKTIRLTGRQICEETPVIADVEPLYSMWLNFYRAVDSGEKHIVSGEDGRNALKLAIAISRSIKY